MDLLDATLAGHEGPYGARASPTQSYTHSESGGVTREVTEKRAFGCGNDVSVWQGPVSVGSATVGLRARDTSVPLSNPYKPGCLYWPFLDQLDTS